jgi:Ca2+-binding EF-hand superfamily protein
MTVKNITIGIGATGLAALLCLGAARDARANEDVDAKFQMMDKNGDGKISKDEHEDAAEEKFKRMDTNHDDKLTAAEMDAAHEKMMGKAGERAGGKARLSSSEKIKMIDTNHDGVVSEDEFEESSKMMFEKLDADKDGYVTKAELKAGHDKMMDKGSSKEAK